MISSLQTHWGFTRMPFGRDLPADNLFRANAHKEAVARLRYLISARGLGVLTGEVGSGKTVAVRAATHGLDTSRHSVIYLPNPAIGTRGLHGAIATALGQAPRFHHAALIPQVERALHTEYAEKGRHVILILDEAHHLDSAQLEALRMLTDADMDAFYLLGTYLGQAVISNAATQILMRQSPQAIDAVADAFGLTSGEARVLLAARRGEGVLLSGTQRVSFQSVASKKEHRLCVTGLDFDVSDELSR